MTDLLKSRTMTINEKVHLLKANGMLKKLHGLFSFSKLLICFLTIIALVLSCKSEPKLIKNQNRGAALGTSYGITYITDGEENFQKEIDSVFEVINISMSTYIPTSDISKINEGDSTLVVDQMFQEVFLLSKSIHSSTKGYFDPTVGVLVNAWGFGPGEQIKLDSAKVDSLLDFVGFEKVQLQANNTIKKKLPQIRFDFNAIAKGYSIDRLAVMLDQKGVENYLIEVGGEVVAKGYNSITDKNWVIGIDDPVGEPRNSPKQLIHLKNRAMASSGNYIKYRVDEETGEKYVHTINPLTGYTKNSTTLGATVFAKNCATADGYATSFMAMDLDEVKQLLNTREELDAYIVYSNEMGTIQEFMTEGFKKLLIAQ
ncbi:FAD:protein FMN transferase [Aurantibacter sp.]|uniref:FAD:protein FMN transferase n=1 Tax=Aurantibacter sp. TaxID=2807103 RepID=UPI00326666A6